MLKLLLFVSIGVVFVTGRESPHADYVRELLSSDAERFSNNIAEDAELDVPGLIAKYGYPVEVHKTVTSDGYILELHRIPHGKTNAGSGPRPAVLLMHGLLSSSADYVVLGPGSALAYILADAGYDVWLGNARGNYYSRHHITIDPDSRDFWKFSWDEIGNFDLPAMIDYALFTSGQKKLHYIGHSQGGTTFLVLNSLRPEYNEKIITFQGLAPASFFDNNEFSIYRSLSQFESILETSAFAMRRMEIFGNREFISWFYDRYCQSLSIFVVVCRQAFGGLQSNPYINSTMIPVILGHAPAGASVRQVAHYGQVIKYKAFRRFNFNTITNLQVYGRLNPPAYDLSLVTAPAYLHYGMNDKEVDYRDVIHLAETLPNTVKLNRIERDTFNHFDFLWAQDAVGLYSTVVDLMKQADRQM